MEKNTRTVGTLILQIALGLMFVVSGIWTLQGSRGDEIASAIYSIFNGDAARVVCIVFGFVNGGQVINLFGDISDKKIGADGALGRIGQFVKLNAVVLGFGHTVSDCILCIGYFAGAFAR